ncbi:MAG: sugar-binding protein [Propionibacteriaceae bacterium]|nr:sugar-binding protein [Propionibacteriaceae bacterium]
MKKLTRLVAVAACAALAIGLGACSSSRDSDSPGGDTTTAGDAPKTAEAYIGIAMPTKSLERWNNDGAYLEQQLTALGYKSTLQYADNKTDQQISQIQNMINDGVTVLVVASIDGTVLGPVLEQAANNDITVIAYDRLINATPNVDYYATFDNYMVGQLQGQYIEEALNLKTADGPFNLEPFAGSPDDNNAKFFFSGAWDVLKPYIDSGKLVVPSGKSPASNDQWQAIGIQGWTTATAQSEMQNRINSFYADKKVDAVLSPNDSLALGIEQALEGAGYQPDVDWPIVTGQDGDLANVKNILADKQAMTVWKDTRILADQVAKMVQEIVTGATVSVNNTTDYNNGIKNVPSYLLPLEVITKANVEERLVGTDFYSADQLGL